MVRMGPAPGRPKTPPSSRPTSRHLTSPLTVQRELRRCRLAWRSPPTRSHGGSQGFKSPHLHPATILVTGLAGRSRRVGVVPADPGGQQTGSNRLCTAGHAYYGPGLAWWALWAVASVLVYRRVRRLLPFILVHALWDVQAGTSDFVSDDAYGWLLGGFFVG